MLFARLLTSENASKQQAFQSVSVKVNKRKAYGMKPARRQHTYRTKIWHTGLEKTPFELYTKQKPCWIFCWLIGPVLTYIETKAGYSTNSKSQQLSKTILNQLTVFPRQARFQNKGDLRQAIVS